MPTVPPRKTLDRIRAISRPADVPIDHALALAARRVVEGSLAIVPGERVLIVVDSSGLPFGQALDEAAAHAGATGQLLKLEDLAARPHRGVHRQLRDALAQAQASVLHIDFEQHELEMRAQFVELASVLRLRHAHMIGVARSSLTAGMSTDPRRIAEVTRALRIRIHPTSVISVRSAAGTNLKVAFEPWCRWYETSGVIRAGTRANLPAGELVSCPASVDGVYVADGMVGDDSGATNTRLMHAPVRIELEGGVVRKLESRDTSTVSLLQRMVRETAHLDRVGLASFGTNVGLSEPADDIFTAQKAPSFHLSLGMTFPNRTGAPRDCGKWIAFTSSGCDIDIDATAVMREGHYLVA